MASVAIPLAVEALGPLGVLIGKLGTTAINLVEAFLPKGTKMPAAISIIQTVLNVLGTGGQLPQTTPAVPTTAQLEQTLEGILAAMKAGGTLVPAGSGLSSAPIVPITAASGQPGSVAATVVWLIQNGYLK
jgi:hypothetical protein